MKHKILIADDSLTIQKVIKITLANEPFELFECVNAQELETKINEIKPSIVLLDFNLSEDKTGYDLTREIKKNLPNSKILMLFGTFDTVDESLLDESGVSHKIVKPFDGTKFINLCRVMADEFDMEDIQSISDANEDFSTNVDDFVEESTVVETEIEDDNWVMEGSQEFAEDSTEEVENEKITEAYVEENENRLEQDMKDWGRDVPGVIGSTSDNALEIPDIIAKQPTSDSAFPNDDDLAFPEVIASAVEDVVKSKDTEAEKESDKLPSGSDLEFPDMDALSNIEIEDKKEKPELVPLDFNDDEPVIEEISVSVGGTDTDEALDALKAEIEDELEDKIEVSSDSNENDLWGADVIVEKDPNDLPELESHKLHQVVDNTVEETPVERPLDSFDEIEVAAEGTPEDFPADVMDEEPVRAMSHVFEPSQSMNLKEKMTTPEITDTTELEEKLREKLTPVVEEFVKEYCQESIERIAWEIIPDLAENLIKKEIQRISDSIMDA